MFGNADYYVARKRSETAPDGPAGNLHPYSWDRLMGMLAPADFQKIKADGFDHVRIVVSPDCMGATPTGDLKGTIDPDRVVDTLLNQVSPGTVLVPTTGSLAVNALALTIKEALDAQLAVYIDCHPWLVSSKHYQQLISATGPANYWKQSWPDWLTTYPGTYKVDYFTSPDDYLAQSPHHPLANYWRSLATRLNSDWQALTGQSVMPTDKVFFQIATEPMVNFHWSRWDMPGHEDEIDDVWWQSFKDIHVPRWRLIQQSAINAIHSVDPGRYVIATSYESFPVNLQVEQGATWGRHSGVTFPAFGNKYDLSEVTRFQQVLYGFHMYWPIKEVTHQEDWKDGLPWKFYYKHPHFTGSPYNDGTPPSGPHNRPIPKDYFMREFNTLTNWVLNQVGDEIPDSYMNGIIITEWGCIWPSNAGLYGTPPASDPPSNNILENRAKWMKDARKQMESVGLCWTVWEAMGGFNVYGGRYWNWGSGERQIHDRGTWGTWVPYVQDALWGP